MLQLLHKYCVNCEEPSAINSGKTGTWYSGARQSWIDGKVSLEKHALYTSWQAFLKRLYLLIGSLVYSTISFCMVFLIAVNDADWATDELVDLRICKV